MIPYGKQSIDDEDIRAVIEALKSDFLTTGPRVNEFEKKICEFTGARYAVGVSNGTAGLHLACLAAGLKENDEGITTPITFAASANCMLYCKAKPIFVDVKENGLIDENKIEEKINSKTRMIIPVHYSGNCFEMEKIKRIADKHGLIIIEDGCHALGSRYKYSRIGDCKYSDMCVFSFHPVKHITTGEGGAITTNSKKIYEKLKCLRNHGITRDNEKLKNKNEGDWWYEMQELGYNYRISDIQCALGTSQLKKIKRFVEKRREIAKKYDSAFYEDDNIEIIRNNENCYNAYHLYIIKLKNEKIRKKLFDYLKKNNILCQVHYIPVYLHPYYEKLGYEKGLCPNAEDFYKRIISLPIYPSLKNEEQDFVIRKIKEFFYDGN